MRCMHVHTHAIMWCQGDKKQPECKSLLSRQYICLLSFTSPQPEWSMLFLNLRSVAATKWRFLFYAKERFETFCHSMSRHLPFYHCQSLKHFLPYFSLPQINPLEKPLLLFIKLRSTDQRTETKPHSLGIARTPGLHPVHCPSPTEESWVHARSYRGGSNDAVTGCAAWNGNVG